MTKLLVLLILSLSACTPCKTKNVTVVEMGPCNRYATCTVRTNEGKKIELSKPMVGDVIEVCE